MECSGHDAFAAPPSAGEFTMTNEEPLPKKARLNETDFKVLPREELILRWKQYEAYVQALEGKYTDLNSNDVTGLRESEEKLKQQQQESARRENILVMRLATKEQEMQECTNQIQYLKQVQQPSVAQLRSTMVDPAINLFFLKMKGELEQTKDKLEQAQNELSAWKFTPDSQTGKKLMAKCRMLIQENQELGRQLSQGRIAQLEAELALQKKYSEELKSSQDELNDFIIQLDEEVEGMQSTILVLQQQLKETRQQLVQYQQQQLQVSTPGTSRTPSCEITDQGETMSKDCSRLANGPINCVHSVLRHKQRNPFALTTAANSERLLDGSKETRNTSMSFHDRPKVGRLVLGSRYRPDEMPSAEHQEKGGAELRRRHSEGKRRACAAVMLCRLAVAAGRRNNTVLITSLGCLASRKKHTLPDLPYDYGALQPHINAEIMQLHHSKHHAAYVNNLNIAEEKYKEALTKGDVTAQVSLQPALKFNGGGHINHSIFWTNLSPKGGGEPKGELLEAIKRPSPGNHRTYSTVGN
ncbi:pre-mRNA-splicing regulator WTAP [Crotalus adamanteus]|uniref:Pre-mRNA-splicing regulator WTAP n=1 Tax=Crotalus adamanteus TaxID=8729 RepID=A0AAW1CCB4_CROAD